MNLVPRRDKVIIQQFKPGEKTPGGIVLPSEVREQGEQYGKVIAAGPGAYTATGQFVPIELKPGDEVVFGKYSGSEVEIEGKKFFVVSDECIFAVIHRDGGSDGGKG